MIEKNRKLLDKINNYYNSEMAAHNKYLNYAAYLDGNDVSGYAKFLVELATDKTTAHMTRTFKYLSNFGYPANINEECVPNIIDYKKLDSMDLKDACATIFKDVLANENTLRKLINKISIEALDDRDVETFNYTQWFVNDALKDISDVEKVIFSIERTFLIIGEVNFNK